MRLRIGAGVNIAPSALETKGGQVRAINAKEGRWDKDMPAYQRMRWRGMQPKGIDGAADLEDRVGDQFDVKYDRMISAVPEGGARESFRRRVAEGEEQAKEVMEAAGMPWPDQIKPADEATV